MNPWFRDYLLLALRLDRHVPGVVDAYYGPPELKAQVEAEETAVAVARLRHEAARLLADLNALAISATRKDYLRAQLTAAATALRKAAGEFIPFAEEVRHCFQITPERVDDARLRESAKALDASLPGRGGVRDRLLAWQKSLQLPPDRIQPAVSAVERDLRGRTVAHLPLPAGESVEFRTVTGKPWRGYNWYLGGCRSRVDINTDLPVKGHGLPNLIAHEAYPGHHTEHAIKDALLWQAEGYPEFTVLLAIAPDCLISEGLANLGLAFLVPEAEREAWLSEFYLPVAGFPKEVASQIVAVTSASRGLRAASGNAAFMLHEDGSSEGQVCDYLCEVGLQSPEDAAKQFAFLTDPLWRIYIFTYYCGENLLRAWLDRVGWATGFRRLVSEPLLPERLTQGAYG